MPTLTPESVAPWVQQQVERFGERLAVEPLQDWRRKHPVQELTDMGFGGKIIVGDDPDELVDEAQKARTLLKLDGERT